MAQLTFTSWLDQVMDYFAKESGIPVEDYASVAGGMGIGAAVSFLTDLFTKGLLNKLINLGVGATTARLGIWGKLTPPRLRKELIPWGMFNLLQVLDMKPSDALELRNSIDDLVSALKLGDAGKLTEALFRSPDELKEMLTSLTGMRLGFEAPPLGAPPAPPLARPTLEAPPPPPAAPALPPEIPALRRATSNSFQPPGPPLAKKLFRSTLA